MKFFKEIIDASGTIAVDETILIKDVKTAAGSKMLEGFSSLFSAEVLVRLEKAGEKIKATTHTGEFGLDLLGEFSHYADKTEPLLHAASEAVKSGSVKAALCVDMNGTPRRGAAVSSVCFLKPTYGTVSRYGVISCAASGEQIGVCAKDSVTVADIMTKISGHDEKDGTSLKNASCDYTIEDVKGKKVAVVKELFDLADEEIQGKINAVRAALEKSGVEVTEIECSLFEIANTAWQILMTAETCNNVSRYDGVKFGHRAKEYKNIDELYVNSRTEGFNFLTKAVILYGSDALSKNRYRDCYDKSLRVRRVVSDAMKEIFSQFDAVLIPASKKCSYESYDIADAFGKVFEESIFTSVANLAGFPAMVGCGVQFMGDHFSDAKLLSLVAAVERKGE